MDSQVVLESLTELGQAGQVGLVWFSIGVAIWQLLLLAKQAFLSVLTTPDNVGTGREQLVGGGVRDMVELSYWVIKFIEDFEKQYGKSAAAGAIKEGKIRDTNGKLFGSQGRSILKMMRYVTKYMGTFDKYYKKNSKT